MKLDRDFFRPQEYDKKIAPEGVAVEVYLMGNEPGQYTAMCFGGKRSRPDCYYRFPNEERRQTFVEKFIAEQERREKVRKDELAERRQSGRGDVDIGTIFYCSWGYDQTNVDFYEVVELVGKTMVGIKKIGKRVVDSSTGADYVEAAAGSFVSDKVKRRRVSNGGIKLDTGYGRIWDGNPKYETAFGWGH